MKHYASPDFWSHYSELPRQIRDLADKSFELVKKDPWHLSLRLKRIGVFWPVRVGLAYRALAKGRPEGLVLDRET